MESGRLDHKRKSRCCFVTLAERKSRYYIAILGVEVDVPMDMKYNDEWSDPPLHIDLKKGLQTLN
ncbi:hypothetical protein SAMN00017477_1879, partial [Peptoniphilus asaccharolyticus DSM 20463]